MCARLTPCRPIPDAAMERAVPILPVDDLAVAREFYVDRLGFEVTFEHTESSHSGLLRDRSSQCVSAYTK